MRRTVEVGPRTHAPSPVRCGGPRRDGNGYALVVCNHITRFAFWGRVVVVVGGRGGGSVGHVSAEGIVPKEGPFVQVMFRVRGVNEL